MEQKHKIILIVSIIILLILIFIIVMISSPPPSSNPTSMPVITQPNTNISKRLGCFGDSENRTLPTHLGTWETVESCGQLAKEYKYYGLQWPEGSPEKGKAQCFAGNNLPSQPSNNCNSGLGGVYANDIYQH
jgi:hypothetical protein